MRGEGHCVRLRPPHRTAAERRTPAPDFERHLLRLGVDLLTEDRARCSDCGRTPLIGEDVHRYERGLVVCELCRDRHRAAPASTERVRHSEAGQTVRLRRAA